jgi:tripartite motif-containing protein 71
LANGVLYAAGYDKTVYALDAVTGAELWQFSVDGAVDYGPAVANGVAYVSTDAGTIYAIGGLGNRSDATPSPVASPDALAEPVEFLWATTGNPSEPFAVPIDLALAPDGNIWVLEEAGNHIQIIDPAGNYVETFGTVGFGPGEFAFSNGQLGGIAFGPDGSIYIADGGNKRVQKFSPDGAFELEWGNKESSPGRLAQPVGVAVDAEGHVYVSDFKLDIVQKYDANGQFLQKFGEPGSAPGQLDVFNNRVSKFAPDGTFLMTIGSRGPGDGQLSEANAVELAPDGTMFVTDTENHRMQAFDAEGNFLFLWGGPGAEDGQFYYAANGLLDGQGNIYVVDAGGGRLQRFALNMAALTAMAGTPVASPVAQ